MLEALLATIIRPCLGQGSNKSAPMPKDEANELFGTLRAEEILAINTAFREQLRVRHLLNQTRPHSTCVLGMPWSGSQRVGYYASFRFCCIFIKMALKR